MLGIKYIRKLYGMTLDNIANLIGVSKQTVSKWENGKTAITEQNLNKLSQAFKQRKEYFFKELTKTDELLIQEQKMKNELVYIDITSVGQDGNEYIERWADTDILEQFPYEIEIEELKEETLKIIKNINYGYNQDPNGYDWSVKDTFQKFLHLIASEKANLRQLDSVLEAVAIANNIKNHTSRDESITLDIADILKNDLRKSMENAMVIDEDLARDLFS